MLRVEIARANCCAKSTCNISRVSVTGKVKDRTLLIVSIEGEILLLGLLEYRPMDVISNIRS